MRFLGLTLVMTVLAPAFGADPVKPIKPEFNGPYFGKLPRAWVEILKVDAERNMMTVRNKMGQEVEVPIRGDTELRVRDHWGTLADYYPGQSVMLFVYHDAAGKWSYPRAVQDEIQMMSLHKWWWTVDIFDKAAGIIELSRKEKDKVFKESFRVGSDTKLWKGETASGLDALQVGDVVLFQTRFEKGQEKRFAVELMDEKGLTAIRAAQTAKHKKRLAADGLPAVVNDAEMLTGALLVSVQWSASETARSIKPGDTLTLSGPNGLKLSAPVAESRGDGVRHKLLLAAHPADMARLRIGDDVRVISAKPK